LFSEKQDRAEL